MSLTVTVDLKKLYKQLCPECKKKLEEEIMKSIQQQAVKRALEGE